jgi:hypothetical protein
MELQTVQNLSADGHSVTVPFKSATVRPLLLNAIGCHCLMLVSVKSIFTIPVGIGNDRGCNTMPKTTKGKTMIMQLTVFKEVHNVWPAKNGKPAGESYDLLCMDISNPPEHRMEEMLYYRTKEDERPKVWGKSVGTTIQVGVSKIRHGDNGGKATLLGSIITEAKKN